MSLSPEFVKIIYRSCLSKILNTYLANDSGNLLIFYILFLVLDISKHVEVIEAVISLIFAIAISPEIALTETLKTDEILNTVNNSILIYSDEVNFVDVFSILLNEDSHSILDTRNKLLIWNQNIQIYLDKLLHTIK